MNKVYTYLCKRKSADRTEIEDIEYWNPETESVVYRASGRHWCAGPTYKGAEVVRSNKYPNKWARVVKTIIPL